jgi:hypothetical protein
LAKDCEDLDGRGAAMRRLREWLELESSDGREMLRAPLDNPIVRIQVRCDDGFIEVVWRAYATSAQMRFVHEQLLDLIRRHRIGKVLGDDTHLLTIHAADRHWIAQDWMPRAAAAGMVAAASSVPATHFGRTAVAAVMEAAPPRIALRSFPDRRQAEAWLKTLPD